MKFIWAAGGVLVIALLLAVVDAAQSNGVLSYLVDMTVFSSVVLLEVSVFSLRGTLLRYYNACSPSASGSAER